MIRPLASARPTVDRPPRGERLPAGDRIDLAPHDRARSARIPTRERELPSERDMRVTTIALPSSS
jgi:hypothetical protein